MRYQTREAHLLAAGTFALLATFTWLGHRQLSRYVQWQRAHPYTQISLRLAHHPARELCDDQGARFRQFSTAMADLYRTEIRNLWQERKSGAEPKFSLLDLGKIQLRINPRHPAGTGFDSSAWSWDEAYHLIRKAQSDPKSKEGLERWRDVDTTVRYLVEKDYARVFLGRKYLPPDEVEHTFLPNTGVRRSGEKEFTVRMNAVDFVGYEGVLKRLLEAEWQGAGWQVKVEWGPEAGLYKLYGHKENARSFVNHRVRVMLLSHLSWTKTVAHELGHVLGFDDHYYNVWNARNCYYTQESRLGDLMSNSEHGVVTARHWEVLDQAYPWRKPAATSPFSYRYGK